MKFHKPGRLAAAQVLGASVLGTTVGISFPLTASAQGGALEEVIVTARKREESLQEIPVAVSALSGSALEEAGLRDLADLGKVIPNVDVGKGNGTTGAGNVFIRGIGARNTGANFDSGVGIYLDGIFMSRPDGALLDNIDIQSVQVLRGPQGTLFGKNTTGGAVLYNTNRPNEEFEGNTELRVGNYGRLDGKFTVNVPLVDDLAYSRLSLFSVKKDGYVENLYNGKTYNDDSRLGGQLQFRFLAGDDVTIDLNTNYSKTHQYGRGQGCTNVSGVPGAGWQVEALDGIINNSTGATVAEHCADVEDLDKDEILGDYEHFKYEVETMGASVTVDWEISDTLSFKSITGWRNTEAAQGDEIDGIAIPFLARTNFGNDIAEPRNTDQWSQEFQLTGVALDDKLNYVVGIFGFGEQTNKGTSHNFNTGPYYNALGFEQSLLYITTATELLTDNLALAAYSQIDWAFADSWNVTLGLRYTKEDRELTRTQVHPDTEDLTLDGSPVLESGFIQGLYLAPVSWRGNLNTNHGWVSSPYAFDDQTKKASFSSWNPMASIQYMFDGAGAIDAGTAYFTIATGFLSGGLSENLSTESTIVNGQEYKELGEYDPEKVITYEIGVKLDAFENTLRFNTALFYSDYTDRQLTTITVDSDSNIAPQTINAKKSVIMGWEVETIWIPVPNFDITFNFALNKGDIVEYDDVRLVIPGSIAGCEPVSAQADLCQVDRSDEDVPRLPTQTYFLAFQYNWETGFGAIIPRLQASYRKDLPGCFDRSSCLTGIYEHDEYDLSARLTWLSPQTDWRVSLYGSNLTNYRHIAGGIPLVDLMNTAGLQYNHPKSYGMELAYNW